MQMKKVILPIVIVVVAGLAAYQFILKKDAKPEGEKQKPITMQENTGAFNQSYATLLSTYFQVKDALVASDTAKATATALALATAADSLKVTEIQGDSSGKLKEVATVFAGTISGSAKGLAGEQDIKGKRKEFEMIADAMWNLTRSVRYGGQKVYWQYCPMAFDNKGAYWLSNERDIKNPYFGAQMLNCGSVEDSLDYSLKQ
jgi:Protein of unknown function (DUF3347)